MRLSKEKKFLYTRIAVLVASIGWIASAFAGLKGFTFWYGGFVLCFWAAFGILNLKQKSSLWLLRKRPGAFLLFYSAFAGAAILGDQFGLNLGLWFYPHYSGLGFLWVYLVLYPFGGFAMLELLYFLSGLFGEDLKFKERPMTKWHGFLDVSEHLLFLLMIGMIVLGAIRWNIPSLPSLTLVAVLWFIFAFIKIRFHVRHAGHYMLILVLATVIGMLLHEVPNTVAREWVYLEAPILSTVLLGFPLWLWVGWYWLLLVPLRLWIFLVLHPKIK